MQWGICAQYLLYSRYSWCRWRSIAGGLLGCTVLTAGRYIWFSSLRPGQFRVLKNCYGPTIAKLAFAATKSLYMTPRLVPWLFSSSHVVSKVPGALHPSVLPVWLLVPASLLRRRPPSSGYRTRAPVRPHATCSPHMMVAKYAHSSD